MIGQFDNKMHEGRKIKCRIAQIWNGVELSETLLKLGIEKAFTNDKELKGIWLIPNSN